MSHFSMLVIFDQEPTEETIDHVMAPWHEFECTGRDDHEMVV